MCYEVTELNHDETVANRLQMSENNKYPIETCYPGSFRGLYRLVQLMFRRGDISHHLDETRLRAIIQRKDTLGKILECIICAR